MYGFKPEGNGPARMSRRPGGGSKHPGDSYAVGDCGGTVSGTPIAAANGAGSPVWNNVKKCRNRMGATKKVTPGNRWQHRTHNPSGASKDLVGSD